MNQILQINVVVASKACPNDHPALARDLMYLTYILPTTSVHLIAIAYL